MVLQILNVMWELAAYAVMAIGSLISTLATNRTNKQLSQEQRSWEENMQSKENAYNAPDNQVERLNQAGINPIAGTMSNGISVSGNTSAFHGSYQLPNIYDPMSMLGSSGSSLGSAFNAFQQGLSDKTFRSARLEQINQQNNKLREDVRLTGASADAQIIANKYADERELWALKNQKVSYKLSYSEISKNNMTVKQLAQNIKNLILEGKETQSNIDLNVLRLDEVAAHIAQMKAETKGVEQHAALEAAQTEQQEHETGRYEELMDNVMKQYAEAVRKLQAESDLTEQEAYWYIFDKADERSLTILGNRFARTRYGEKQYRNAFNSAFDEAMSNR